ncbi:MAG TPA: PTS sugar transporter subunit IIA [Phycisphaerae bacterium]|nr:PTS sugar transporter subunit IIA [Phycisphaerae bacterium]HUT61152.1 PTS sugar transporter subunit IIA [Phycisphaerae bacterium]
MPGEQMNEQQAAAYLHMDMREVAKLASRGQMPCRRVADGFVFRKRELDHWVEAQMHKLGRQRLADIEKGVSAHHGFDHGAMLIEPMIPPQGLAVPLKARTRKAVIRELVAVADRSELVYAPNDLVEEVLKREELCPTALAPDVALPHPRHPLPHDIAASFVSVGLTPSGVPYGSQDGTLTRLFFLVCCKDDRTHLHVLARLAQMLHDRRDIDRLLAVRSTEEMRSTLTTLEQAAIRAT